MGIIVFFPRGLRLSLSTCIKTCITCCMILVNGYILKVHTSSLKFTVQILPAKKIKLKKHIVNQEHQFPDFPNFKLSNCKRYLSKLQMFISSNVANCMQHLKVSHWQNNLIPRAQYSFGQHQQH